MNLDSVPDAGTRSRTIASARVAELLTACGDTDPCGMRQAGVRVESGLPTAPPRKGDAAEMLV
jgi:hypothetical protein